MVQKMTPPHIRDLSPIGRRIAPLVLLAALVAAPLSAPRAQDSFTRVADGQTGQQVLSVLGTGVGMAYASLALELRCPVNEAWTIDVTGVRAPAGTAVDVGFGDAGGGWTPIRVAPLRFGDRSLSVGLDDAVLHAALERARLEDQEAGEG